MAATAIVLRTRDRPLLLARALDSILGQTTSDWSLIVVNDGGDPRPVDRLIAERERAFDGRVQLLHNPVSGGMEAASNLALRQSHSEFVVVHDDDDRWAPDFLARTTATLGALPPRWGGVVTKSLLVRETLDADTVTEIDSVEFNPSLTQITLAEVATANQFPPIAFLFRRAALDAVGAYREDLPVLGDWEFNLRFLLQFDIAVLPEILAYWHHRVEADDPYRNSSGAPHEPVRAQLRNAALRADLIAGRFGLGDLMNRHSATLEQAWRNQQNLQSELEAQARELQGRDQALRGAQQREAAATEQSVALQSLVATLQRDVGILQGHVDILNREVVAVLQARVDELLGEVRSRDDRLVAARGESARLEARLQQAMAREAQASTREQEAVARSQREIEAHLATLATLQRIERSISWRLTAPLRALRRLRSGHL